MTRRRLVWLVLALVVLVAAVLTTAALLRLPTLVRQATLWQLRSATGRPVTLDTLDLSLREGRISLRGLRITDRDGGLLAEIGRLDGSFHPWSLLRGYIWIQNLVLTDGHVRIVRTGPDRFNISDLLEGPASSGSRFDMSIDQFTISQSWVSFEDRMLEPARTWRTDDLRLDARNLTTLGRRGTVFASTGVAGALVTLRADDVQLGPTHLRASINVRDLDLRLATLYLPGDGPLRLERGGLNAGVSLVVDAKDGTSLDAEAVVDGLALRRPGLTDDAVTAPRLDILVRELHQRPGLTALRYASLGGDVTVLDPTQTPPRRLTFTDLTVTAGGLEQPMKDPAQIAVHANVPGGGEVDITGTAGVAPRRADLRVRARGLELASLARYLPLEGRLAGTATADVRVVATYERALGVTITGDTTLDRVALGDASRTLAGATRVKASALRYTWPATATVGQLTVTQPSVTIERGADGSIGLASLLRERAAPPDAPGATPTPAVAPDIRIANLTIEDGRALVTDAGSNSRVEVTRLAASARDVTWPGRGPATLELTAAIAGAEVAASGTVDAAQRQVDVNLGLRGADLALLQPWLPIAGRARGALSRADLRVSGRQGDTLALTVTGNATLERVAVADGSQPVVVVARLTAGGLEYTWPATIRVADLTLTQPSVTVERDAAGGLNLASLARPSVTPAAAADNPATTRPAPDVTITRLRIDDGRATIADAASGGSSQVSGIAFTGSDVTWPARGTARVRLAAAVAGGQMTARGTLDGAQHRGEIAVTLRGADLATLQSWLPIVGRVGGAADADVTAIVDLEPFLLTLRGAVAASNLAFSDTTRPLLTVTRVDATGIDLQWPARLSIDQLRVNTPWAQIDRTPQGELSLRALFRRRPDRPEPPPPTVGPQAAGLVAGMELSVRDVLFENGGTNIVDDAVEPAARFEIRGSRLALRNLTWPAQGPSQVQLSTPMPGGGALKASGTFSVEPTQLQLEAELDQIDLAPGRPYLPFDARIAGKLTGRARINGAFGETTTLVIDGDAAVDRLALGDADRRLATAQRAELTGVRYQYPTSVRLREVTVRKPWALVERKVNGELEIVALLNQRRQGATPAPTSTGSPAGTPATAASRVRVAIDRLTLADGFLRFVDRTTNPDYAEELGGITLTAEGLGTNPRRHGTVDLRGTLASGTPLTIRGQISAFTGPRFLDLAVDVKDFPVLRLNPYLDRLSSWIARQGSLTASMRCKLDGDDLEASNDVTIVGLDLDQGGKGNEFQKRIGLPLGTLVPLLKNRQGVIQLNIPVHGQLSSPEFDYSEAVWTALRGLAIKLVSLPFSWIGQMLYTEDAKIDSIQVYPVPFEVARPAPTSFGRDHLQRLTTFLKEQPAIRLRLRPVTTVADVTALRRDALNARLAAAGSEPGARRQAAVAIYAELFPRRQPPDTDEALLAELTRETPTPQGALRTLTTARTATVRDALVQGGVGADRLEPAEARAAVESEGDPRVEFEIAR
ncbi:MAG TPA: DUF748 domain-containing protein [Candidatus Acidoferrum sp.]|nr:DUF748 domain-containing protein [Candidatus Acidoferrum sp.]